MKKRYQIEQQRAVQQFRQLATEQNPNIQMVLADGRDRRSAAGRRRPPAAARPGWH